MVTVHPPAVGGFDTVTTSPCRITFTPAGSNYINRAAPDKEVLMQM